MGDRCDMTVTLHGCITTIEIFDQVVDALVAETGWKKSEVIQIIQDAIDKNLDPDFHLEEINYGNIEDLERILESLKIDYHVSQGAGSEYPADNSVIATTVCNGDWVISHSDLEKLLQSEDPLKSIKDMLEQTAKAGGTHLPDFSVSHEVRGWLTIDGPSLQKQQKEETIQ